MPRDNYIAVVSAIDQSLDRCEELIKVVDRGVSGRELALVRTKLQEARMWMKQAQQEKLYEHRQEGTHA